MALSANAAFETVSPDFSIDSLQANFLLGPDANLPMDLEVTKLSDGGRFAVRTVHMRQAGKLLVHSTVQFARGLSGESMQHTVGRATRTMIDEITLDDLEVGRNDRGPYMRYQRLGVFRPDGHGLAQVTPGLTYTSACTVSPPIVSESSRLHAIGIILLSDYHVLDCPPTVHGRETGQPAIGDYERSPRNNHFKQFTTLNHSIHFRVHDGFRADDLVYLEANSPWAGNRRGEILTRMFTRDGMLVATCKQEGYYVLKEKEAGKL